VRALSRRSGDCTTNGHARTVAKAQAKLDELEAAFERARTAYTQAKAALDKKRQALSQWDDELKRLEGRAAKLVKDERDTDATLAKLLTAHPWVEQERQFFGKAHTECVVRARVWLTRARRYDFEDKDIEGSRERHKQLEHKQAELARKINKKALAMMEKAELEYDDLDKKRRIIERDRATIERVIEGLDKKKNEALLTTYEKVNKVRLSLCQRR